MSKYQNRYREVTDEDKEYITNNYKVKTQAEMGNNLGFSRDKIQTIMRSLNIKNFSNKKWSKYEEEFLRNNYPSNGSVWCSERLVDRSYMCIQKKAAELGLSREYEYTYIADGYRMVGSHRAGERKAEHRKVMEKILGRELTYDDVVHHKDGNKLNNDPSNLEVMTRSKHASIHYADSLGK